MKKSLQISEEEKRTILIKYNLLEDSKKEPKIKSISCLKDDPNGATASDVLSFIKMVINLKVV